MINPNYIIRYYRECGSCIHPSNCKGCKVGAKYAEKVIDFLENQEDYRMTPQDREMIRAHGYELYKFMQKERHPNSKEGFADN
jgi:hypothetical protein